MTIDQNWRWLHETSKPKNCYTGNQWDATLCPDEATCLQNCAIEGADEEYSATYGINASDDALALGFVTNGTYSRNVGSRTFLLEVHAGAPRLPAAGLFAIYTAAPTAALLGWPVCL